MPYLNLKLTISQSAETSAAMAELLTDLTTTVLNKKRALTSVAVEYINAEHWFLGAESIASQPTATCYLEVKITEGTNSKDEKAAYVEKVFAGIEANIGPLHPASYIVLHEVRADAWGYQGATQESRYIKGKLL